jgi:hypothetical protein
VSRAPPTSPSCEPAAASPSSASRSPSPARSPTSTQRSLAALSKRPPRARGPAARGRPRRPHRRRARGLASELEEQIDRYLLVHLAERVLDRVTDRYARDNQPAILQYTSELLTRITEGRHVRAVVQPETRTLATVGRDGQLRSPATCPPGHVSNCSSPSASPTSSTTATAASRSPWSWTTSSSTSTTPAPPPPSPPCATSASHTQVVLLTCHRRWLDITRRRPPDARILELPPESPPDPALHGPGRAAEA